MELQELKDKLKIADEEAKKIRFSIFREYALSHNKVAIGDIVSDKHKTILVEKIKVNVSFSYDKPECVYCGIELNKDFSVKKKKGADKIPYSIFQCYLEQINGINITNL